MRRKGQLDSAGAVRQVFADVCFEVVHHVHRLPEPGVAFRDAGYAVHPVAIWTALGERRNPRIVFEHSGEGTIPTSMYVCDGDGMVVICGGTSGYNADVDLRFLWMRQKRLQGSHFANTRECAEITELVARGLIDPCLSTSAPFERVGDLHQLMYDNEHPPGNMAVRVNALEPGQRDVAL